MGSSLKYNCVFGGGGIRGMCYIGAIQALEELQIEICDIAGSSVGAVFASLYAIGYSKEEIKEFFLEFNFNMFRDINIGFFSNSISKGEIFLDWLRDKLGKKYFGSKYKQGIDKVRFKDIDKNLYILALDINTNKPFVFSKETTPDEEIAFAVRASASLPGLMEPIKLGNSILVDGDLIKSWAGHKIFEKFKNSENRLLEFRLEGSRESDEIKNPMDFASSILNTIWYLSTENVVELNNKNDKYDYVVIDTKDVILFDFAMSKEDKQKLIDVGYLASKKYFLESLVQKKKKVLSIYKKLLLNINLLKESVCKNDVKQSLFVINEILSTMVDDTENIDYLFYLKMKDLKEFILLNSKKYFLFKQQFQNCKQVFEQVCSAKNAIEDRVSELIFYINKYTK